MKIKKEIIIAIIIGLSVLGYGYMNQRTKLQIEESRVIEKKAEELRLSIEKETQEGKLKNCLNNAEKSYNANWNKQCRARGLADDCLLPIWLAESTNESRKIVKDRCIKAFK